MKLTAFAVAAGCALAVSACSSAQQAQLDASVQKYAAQIQAYCPQITAGLPIVASLSGPKAQTAFVQAQSAATTICANKITNSADAAAAVVAAYIAMQNAGVKFQVAAQ